MVYKPNSPLSTDFISQSQMDIKNNFETLSNIWGKSATEKENVGDHVALYDAKEDNRGCHKKTTLKEQSADPVSGAAEVNLYSKDNSGTTELYYQLESAGDINRITSSGRAMVGGLVLRAMVIFDLQGTILEADRLDADGKKIKVPISYNVSSITNNTAPISGRNIYTDWTINFTSALPTADYMWILHTFNNLKIVAPTSRAVHAQPKNDATYSNIVTASSFRVYGYNMTGGGPVFGRFDRIIFQAYTVEG